MKNVKTFLLLAFVGTLAWTSCKKGDTGATGPAGADGAAGPAGPGSVTYSGWITLDFTYIPTGDTTGYFSDTVSAPSVTQGILDSGAVLGYIDAAGDGSAIIPISGAETIGFGETYAVGKIIVEEYTKQDYSGVRYRYVTLPGTKTAGNSTERKYGGYTITELKSMSYDKVKTIAASAN